MKLAVSPADRAATLRLSAKLYSLDSLRIAAYVFASRAEVGVEQEGARYEVTLTARKKSASPADLRALAGEFLNELLSQEYRFLVGRFNQKIANLITTQALLSARGGQEATPGCVDAEKTAEFEAETRRLMSEAEEEIRRTMPKRLPPQGSPLPPAPAEADA